MKVPMLTPSNIASKTLRCRRFRNPFAAASNSEISILIFLPRVPGEGWHLRSSCRSR